MVFTNLYYLEMTYASIFIIFPVISLFHYFSFFINGTNTSISEYLVSFLDFYLKSDIRFHLCILSEDLFELSMNPSGKSDAMDTTEPRDPVNPELPINPEHPAAGAPPGNIQSNETVDLDSSMDEDGKSTSRTTEPKGDNDDLLDYDDDEIDPLPPRKDRFKDQDSEVGGDRGQRDRKSEISDPQDMDAPPSSPPANPPQVAISFAGFGSDQRKGSESDNVFFTDRELEPESPAHLDISVHEPEKTKLNLESIPCKPLFDGVVGKKTKLTMVDQSHAQSNIKCKTISYEVRDNSKLEEKANLRVNYYGPSGRTQKPVPLSKVSLSFDGNKCLCKARHSISCDQHLLLILTDESLPPTLGVEGNC